jgi:hypothetical protein
MAILWLAAGLLSALGFAEAALGATPVGPQFQVNTYTTSRQSWPSVAVDADGDFVVVWESKGSAGNDDLAYSIQAQRYDASGNAVGSEFQVNTYTTGYQTSPSVAVDADGDFVVVWESAVPIDFETSICSIQGQRYDASGNIVGSEFQVNTYTAIDPGSLSDVAVGGDGGFVVVWESWGSAGTDVDRSIQGQRYDASGNRVGTEFQVNSYTTGRQLYPSVAADADGDFVVVWASYEGVFPDDYLDVRGQRYDASGNAVGAEFLVNTYTSSVQSWPSVAVDADGGFVVVWQSWGNAGSDNLGYSVQAQRYDASGNAIGAEFQVNPSTTHEQGLPSVAADEDGGFVVVWASGASAGPISIQGQRYDASGNAIGAELQVNTYTTSHQWGPSVAADADGGFVVVWQSYGSAGSDTSDRSIQGRRYTAPAPRVPSLTRPGVIGLTVLLFGTAAAALRGRLRGQS